MVTTVGLLFNENLRFVSCAHQIGPEVGLTYEIWCPRLLLTESETVLAKAGRRSTLDDNGGVAGGVIGSPKADWLEKVLLSPMRGLCDGLFKNAFSKLWCIEFRSLRVILASGFIGGVSGGDAGSSYFSKYEMSFKTSRCISSMESLEAAIAGD